MSANYNAGSQCACCLTCQASCLTANTAVVPHVGTPAASAFQPSRIVRDRSSARLFRDGPDELPPGLFLLAETPRFAGCLDELFQFVAHFLFPWLLPLLVCADGFEPPCLVRPDLQSGAFNRSATHPKTCLENAQGPESCSEHPGLVAFDLSIYRLELSISIRDACLSVPIVVLISKRRTNWAACG